MGVERQVITPRVKGGKFVPILDYEALQVGDWFVVRSNAIRSTVRRSISRNRTALQMTFAWTETEFHVYRVERTS